MEDWDFDREHRLRRGRWLFAAVSVALVVGLVAAGFWIRSQTPAVVALQPAAAQPSLPATQWDERAAQMTQRLAAAAGRSLLSLADEAPEPSLGNPLEEEASTVGGAQAAREDFTETRKALEEAEAAAAEQLALSAEELRRAEAGREEAAADLAREEAAAADAIDAAIAAAISAAQATAAFSVPLRPDLGPAGSAGATIPRGAPTSSAEVLKYVRKYFPADQVGNAMAVARCESGHANRVSAPNADGSRDWGVFQINDGGTLQATLRSAGIEYAGLSQARERALETQLNVRLARSIWDTRGWQPWVCAAKLRIVAGLYQRTPGPMAGNYDEYGRAQ